MKNFIIGALLIAILGLILYFAPHTSQAPTTTNNQPLVVDYDTCVAANNPITQGKPLTCTTADGRDFVDTTAVSEPDVVIDTPVIAQTVTSPMTVKGKARGSWFFEANLPILLKDENGKVLAQVGYHTTENWMTNDYVSINTTLKFPAPTTDYGVLVIHNDNPSGDPANDKTFEVPVRFR